MAMLENMQNVENMQNLANIQKMPNMKICKMCKRCIICKICKRYFLNAKYVKPKLPNQGHQIKPTKKKPIKPNMPKQT